MTDINFSRGPADPNSQGAAGASPASRAGELRWDIIELLFFAYRDFVGDADNELEAFGFGRAHHRVMHFVHRYPGLKVADLLDVLRITKQSLGRVLKQLLDEGYIVQKTGNNDRRQRLLMPPPRAKPWWQSSQGCRPIASPVRSGTSILRASRLSASFCAP